MWYYFLVTAFSVLCSECTGKWLICKMKSRLWASGEYANYTAQPRITATKIVINSDLCKEDKKDFFVFLKINPK